MATCLSDESRVSTYIFNFSCNSYVGPLHFSSTTSHYSTQLSLAVCPLVDMGPCDIYTMLITLPEKVVLQLSVTRKNVACNLQIHVHVYKIQYYKLNPNYFIWLVQTAEGKQCYQGHSCYNPT